MGWADTFGLFRRREHPVPDGGAPCDADLFGPAGLNVEMIKAVILEASECGAVTAPHSFQSIKSGMAKSVVRRTPEEQARVLGGISSLNHLAFLELLHRRPFPDMPATRLAAEIAEEGVMQDHFPVVARPRGQGLPPRKVQEIRCGGCGATEERSARVNPLPAHTMTAWCTKRGWKVVAVGRHVCPACRAKGPATGSQLPVTPLQDVVMSPKPALKPGPKTTTPVMPERPAAKGETAPGGVPTPAASSALVVCYLLIEEHYDRGRKAYGAGWDDERIAKETGLALSVVQERRERDFGPLVKDTTLDDLRQALKQVLTEVDAAGDSLQAAAANMTEATSRLRRGEAAFQSAIGLVDRLAAKAAEKAA